MTFLTPQEVMNLIPKEIVDEFYTAAKVSHIKKMTKNDERLIAARYSMHAVRAAQYAIMALSGKITDEEARQEYAKAMDNYDGIIRSAKQTVEGNFREMAKGADAVTELIEKNRG